MTLIVFAESSSYLIKMLWKSVERLKRNSKNKYVGQDGWHFVSRHIGITTGSYKLEIYFKIFGENMEKIDWTAEEISSSFSWIRLMETSAPPSFSRFLSNSLYCLLLFPVWYFLVLGFHLYLQDLFVNVS